MITPNYDDMQPSFGPLFTRKFLVKVDEYTGISEINERSPPEAPLQETRSSDGVTGVRYFSGTKGIEAAGLYDKHP